MFCEFLEKLCVRFTYTVDLQPALAGFQRQGADGQRLAHQKNASAASILAGGATCYVLISHSQYSRLFGSACKYGVFTPKVAAISFVLNEVNSRL